LSQLNILGSTLSYGPYGKGSAVYGIVRWNFISLAMITINVNLVDNKTK